MRRLSVLGLILVGCTTLVRAQGVPGAQADALSPAPAPDAPPAEVVDNNTTPLHLALLDYKRGAYDKARTEIDAAEKVNPGDLTTELLKAKILTEEHDFTGGEKLLRGLLTPTGPIEVQMALGDLLLRARSFDRAAKYYGLALAAKPNDPDITLKLVYAKVGSSDLITAGQYASKLSPMDPKNPYDEHPCYYFAKAALAQATGNVQGSDDDIQNARTIYGNTVTNRYLRTYLDVFVAKDKNATNPDLLPPPILKPTPSSAK